MYPSFMLYLSYLDWYDDFIVNQKEKQLQYKYICLANVLKLYIRNASKHCFIKTQWGSHGRVVRVTDLKLLNPSPCAFELRLGRELPCREVLQLTCGVLMVLPRYRSGVFPHK